MWLPAEKLTKIKQTIKQRLRAKFISHKDLKRLNGKLRHAAMVMPWANRLFHPINIAFGKSTTFYQLNLAGGLTNTLDDFTIIINLVERTPTSLTQLIPAEPDIIGKVDILKLRAGGIWYSAHSKFKKFVWQFKFLANIQQHLEVQLKGNKNTTNSDLETFGFVYAFLILEQNMLVRGQHIRLYCNNSLTISWMRRLSVKSPQAA